MIREPPRSPLCPYPPLFGSLGDVRSRAVTLGKIADVLAGRGETDEALRIRREEELPVFERLGDRKSTGLNSRHLGLSHAGLCLPEKSPAGHRPGPPRGRQPL